MKSYHSSIRTEVDIVEEYYTLKKYSFGSDKENVHEKIISFIGSGHRILDVGCAQGYLSKLLKEKGNIVFGIEISEEAVRGSKEIFAGLVVGNIERVELPWPDKFFDVIICADVLEHLFDPTRVLSKLRRILANDGVLIASIPNIAYYGIRKALLLGRFDYQDRGILDKGHIRFFTLDTAQQMFKEAGYDVLEVDLSMYLPTFIHRLNRVFRIIPGLLKKMFPKLLGFQFIFIAKPHETH